jgi:hypothetical protein
MLKLALYTVACLCLLGCADSEPPAPTSTPAPASPTPAELSLPPLVDGKVEFEKHVAPILRAKCFECHGAKEKIKGDFRVDNADDFFAGGETSRDDSSLFPFVTPGKTELGTNFFLDLLEAEDKKLRMPPPKKNNAITEAQFDILLKWIEQGADWPDGFVIEKE